MKLIDEGIELRAGTVVAFDGAVLNVREVWLNGVKVGHVYYSSKAHATFGSDLGYCLNGMCEDDAARRVVAMVKNVTD